ncbi:TIGR02266 family protein [Myxococcus sp. AM010]|nr:TIGR02266 family protein [Myxococcus sp. AM010]
MLGPLALQALRELISSGRLKAAVRASRDGTNWVALPELPELRDLFASARPSPSLELQQAERLRAQMRAMQSLPAHEVFGLKPTANLDELRLAYFRMAKRFTPDHVSPDTHPELKKVSAEIFDFLSRRMRAAEATWTQAAPTYSSAEFVGLERRSDDRIHADVKVTLQNAGIFTDHRIINLSSGGLFIATDKPLRLGTLVELTLRFDEPPRVLTLRSSVIWENSLEDGKNPRGYGLRLSHLRQEEKEFVQQYLARAKDLKKKP